MIMDWWKPYKNTSDYRAPTFVQFWLLEHPCSFSWVWLPWKIGWASPETTPFKTKMPWTVASPLRFLGTPILRTQPPPLFPVELLPDATWCGHHVTLLVLVRCSSLRPIKKISIIRFILANTRSSSTVLTLRQLMSYIYGAPILDVSRSHTTTQHSR